MRGVCPENHPHTEKVGSALCVMEKKAKEGKGGGKSSRRRSLSEESSGSPVELFVHWQCILKRLVIIIS